MADDLLPPSDPPAPISSRERPSKIVCEFCECTLAASGDVLKRGGKAAAMMKLDDRIAALERQVTELEAERDRLKQQIPPARKSALAWD